MRDADHDRPSIGEEIVDAVGNGDAGGIRAEVVIVDQTRRQIPARSGILESTNQFALLGIDADDGEAAALEAIPKVAEVEELIVAVGAEVVGELLVIDAQRIAHLMEETGNRVGADKDTEVTQRHGNLGSGPP